MSGSSGGLGKEICKCLLKNGAVVIGLDVKKNNINAKKFHFYKIDLNNKIKLISLRQELKKNLNQLIL